MTLFQNSYPLIQASDFNDEGLKWKLRTSKLKAIYLLLCIFTFTLKKRFCKRLRFSFLPTCWVIPCNSSTRSKISNFLYDLEIYVEYSQYIIVSYFKIKKKPISFFCNLYILQYVNGMVLTGAGHTLFYTLFFRLNNFFIRLGRPNYLVFALDER